MWQLTQGWYGDRLTEPFVPKTRMELQTLLSDAGLTSAFWQLG